MEDHLLARIALEKAVELQPGYAEAWAALAVLLVDEYRHLFNPRPNSLERAMLAAERALDADPSSQMANYAFAVVQYFRGDLGAFRAAAERALPLNPRCSYTMAWVGRLYCYSGDWERGIQLSTRAIQLSPHHPGWYHFGIFFNEGAGNPSDDQHAGLLGNALYNSDGAGAGRQPVGSANRSRTHPATLSKVRAILRQNASPKVDP